MIGLLSLPESVLTNREINAIHYEKIMELLCSHEVNAMQNKYMIELLRSPEPG